MTTERPHRTRLPPSEVAYPRAETTIRLDREIHPYIALDHREPNRFTVLESKWPRVALVNIVDLRLSSVDKKTRPGEERVSLCNYTNVYNNNFIRADIDFMKATASEREIQKCRLEVDDVVITKDSEKHDDIGVPALISEDIANLVCGYHLAILRPLSPVLDGGYLFYALGTYEAKRQFQSYANGITRFGLRRNDIGLVKIPFPPLAEQRKIAAILSSVDATIEKTGVGPRLIIANECLHGEVAPHCQDTTPVFDTIARAESMRDRIGGFGRASAG